MIVAFDPHGMVVNDNPKYVRDCCEASLGRLGVDYINLYYYHRIDNTVPIEETIIEMKKLVGEGKVKYIGLSEASLETIRQAHDVHPIIALQMEWSLWTRGIKDEIVPLCRRAVVESIPPNSYMALYPRFIGDNLEKNKMIYFRIEELAAKHNCTPAQLALAWVLHQGDDVAPIPGLSYPQAKMPKRSKKGIISKFFGLGSSSRASAQRSDDEALEFDLERYIMESTQRAMDYASAPAEFSPTITDVELEAFRLPSALTGEAFLRNRDHERDVAKFNEKLPEIHELIAECNAKIAEAEQQEVNLDVYRKRKGGRGDANFWTKVDRNQRVVLQWNEFGTPVGPGNWGHLFQQAIGCIVRRCDLWEVAFSFSKNGYQTLRGSWLELLRYFVMEDDIDRHWEYVRKEMAEKFKKYRNKLKTKYIKNEKYEEDWQRMCGMPANVKQESFTYLLIHWRTKYAQDEAERNTANRLKNPDRWYGGSVKGSQYRSYVDKAGGDASLAVSWQVFHSKDDMPEDQLQTQRQHWESLAEADRQYRDAHPDYPATQSILPIDVETNILEHEFSNSASKDYVPMWGKGSSSRERTSTSSSRSGYGYGRQIDELEAQLQQEREARIALEQSHRNTQEQLNALMQQSQMPQNPEMTSIFDQFQAWYASQMGGGHGGGQGGASGGGGQGGASGGGGQSGWGGQ